MPWSAYTECGGGPSCSGNTSVLRLPAVTVVPAVVVVVEYTVGALPTVAVLRERRERRAEDGAVLTVGMGGCMPERNGETVPEATEERRLV